MSDENLASSFGHFYAFYLTQHRRPWTRLIHVLATVLSISWAVGCWIQGAYAWILFGFVLAYGPAWFSHFWIEKNRPATFRYPLYSLVSDFRFLFDVIMRRQRIGF